MKVLLVDDEDDLRREICEYLRRRGHEVVSCGSLTEARSNVLAMVGGDPPKVVVCDVNLGDGNGADFCRETAPLIPACHWLLISGAPDASDLEERLSTIAGPRRWTILDKPISLSALNKAIENHR